MINTSCEPSSCSVRKAGQSIVCLSAILIIGIAAHGLSIFNLSPNHDYSFAFYISQSECIFQIKIGRIFVPIVQWITGAVVATPTSIGFISLVFLALTALLIGDSFHLSAVGVAVVGALLVTCRGVSALFATYLPWATSQILAIFLAVSAFHAWGKHQRSHRISSLAFVFTCLVVILGLYPTTILVFPVLVCFKLLLEILYGQSINQAVRSGFMAATACVLAAAFYFLISKGLLLVLGFSASTGYNSPSSVLTTEIPLSERVYAAMAAPLRYLIGDRFASAWPKGLTIAVLVVYSGLFLMPFIRANKKSLLTGSRAVSCVILCFLMSLCAVLPFIVTPYEAHDLTIWGAYTLLLTPAIGAFIDFYKYGNRGRALIGPAFLVVALSLQTANLIHTVKLSDYWGSVGVAEEAISRVDRLENYAEGETPVVFVGDMSTVLKEIPQAYRVRTVTGMSLNLFKGDYTTPSLMANSLRRKALVIPSTSEDAELVKGMGVFPSADSVKMIDGKAYVKLS